MRYNLMERKANKMNWVFTGVDKETEHRFLNFYTVHYKVTKDDGSLKDYSYFLASRNEKAEDLRVYKQDFQRADAVLIGVYRIIDDKLYLLLEKQYRPALNHDIYSFPAGLVDKEDKSIEDAAIRELREETGYEMEDVTLLLPPSPTSEGLSDECNAVVTGRLLGRGEEEKEEFEDIQAKLYSKEEVNALLMDKEVIFSNSARLLILYLLEKFKNLD